MDIALKLRESVLNGDVESVKKLLADGADPNIQDIMNGATCVHSADAGEDFEILKMLLEHGADPNIPTQNTDSSALGVAALNNSPDIARMMIENGAKLSQTDILTGLLQECLDLGHEETVLLIKRSMNLS